MNEPQPETLGVIVPPAPPKKTVQATDDPDGRRRWLQRLRDDIEAARRLR